MPRKKATEAAQPHMLREHEPLEPGEYTMAYLISCMRRSSGNYKLRLDDMYVRLDGYLCVSYNRPETAEDRHIDHIEEHNARLQYEMLKKRFG